jgi:hypothetical protein
MSEAPAPVLAPAAPPAPPRIHQRRGSDKWYAPFTHFWDWVDERDIDKGVISLVILYGTWELTRWAMDYAMNGQRPGLEIAAIIAAVTTPYMALQGAAIKFYFESRKKNGV